MRRIHFALASFVFVAFFATNSMAQLQRSFVSGLGDDGNPCTRTAPCRTFAHAILQTNAGGEVVALDSAGYGAFSISTAVSVIAPPGVYAGITVFSGDGIQINAGSSDTVILRGLTVNNQGSLGNGIVFNSGGTLHVESCTVEGFRGSSAAGVLFRGAGTLEVKDSIMRDNYFGIDAIILSSGTAVAAIDHVRLETCRYGVAAGAGSKVTVRNSIASNGENGFVGSSASGAPAELNVENCVASNNVNTGIWAVGLSTWVATVRVSNSTVTNNGTGLENDGPPAVLLSRGNNTVEGNSVNTVGAIGSFAAK